jgi:hypothetical protein
MFIENKYVNRKLKKGGNSVPPASVEKTTANKHQL